MKFPINLGDILSNFTYSKSEIDGMIASAQTGATQEWVRTYVTEQLMSKENKLNSKDISNKFTVSTSTLVNKEESLSAGKWYRTNKTPTFTTYGDSGLLRINFDSSIFINKKNNYTNSEHNWGVLIGTFNGYISNGSVASDGQSRLYINYTGRQGIDAKCKLYLMNIKNPELSQKRAVNFDFLGRYVPNQ